MLRRFAACTLRAAAGCSQSCRVLSTDIDYSHEKPAPFQLEHVQARVVETIPLMFKQRLDYTFYRKDVFCDDQIFGVKKYIPGEGPLHHATGFEGIRIALVSGLDQLMQHFGTISVVGQFTLPHVQMEAVSVVPVIEDGTVRCRWRVKYVSIIRLLMNPRLLRFEYRMKNLSWFDGYSVLTVDGNGLVFKITLQKTQRDDGKLLDKKSTKEKLAEKIAVFRPGPAATHFVDRQRHLRESSEDTDIISKAASRGENLYPSRAIRNAAHN